MGDSVLVLNVSAVEYEQQVDGSIKMVPVPKKLSSIYIHNFECKFKDNWEGFSSFRFVNW